MTIELASEAGHSISKQLCSKLQWLSRLKTWLITISVAVSFLLSLIISVSLIGKKTITTQKKILKQIIFLFIGFLMLITIFFFVYSKYTISIPLRDKVGDIRHTVIVKGLFYTPNAKIYRNKLAAQNLSNTDDVLLEDSGFDIGKVWSTDSRTYCRLMMLILYTAMITFYFRNYLDNRGYSASSKKSPRSK